MGDKLDEAIGKVLDKEFLPARLTWDSAEGAGRIIDNLLLQHDKEQAMNPQVLLCPEFLLQVKQQVMNSLEGAGLMAEIAVIAPVTLWSAMAGYHTPDQDIRLLGIGYHRYFLFHSAIGVAVLKFLYNRWTKGSNEEQGWVKRWLQKVSGVALGAYAFGIGVHLMTDVFQPKAVIFPFVGSLVHGTLVDDNIWLFGNSLWAFKISYDMFALTMADDFKTAKRWTAENFGGVKSWRALSSG